MEQAKHKKWHFAACAVTLITFAAHVFAGGPENYMPLRDSSLSAIPKSTLSVVWHMITVQLAVFAIALWWLARTANPALLVLLVVSNLGFAAVFLVYSIHDFATPFALPQWTAFVATALLVGLGARAT